MRHLRFPLLTFLLLAACDTADRADPCAAGTRCGDACVDTATDPAHCGACGVRCAEGEVCADGACAAACPAGRAPCAGGCFDLQTSAAHCGACGSACPAGATCMDGACACPAGHAECGGACVDLAADDAHCGGCGVACEAGASCVDGACAPGCAAGERRCDGACVDLGSDPAHCGACGRACTGGAVCAGGACVCPAGTVACDGTCVDVASDPAHCGGCGAVCAAGEGAEAATCVEGACVQRCEAGRGDCDGDPANGCEARLDEDVDHCGACGAACAPGDRCEAGVCCAPDHLVCGGVCVDPGTDPVHCGGCDASCTGWPASEGGVCEGGTCVLACAAGADDCNGDLADGCETDLDTDRFHCGACGNVCGALCGDGACLSVALGDVALGHVCAHLGDGSVYCWGNNAEGQLADGTTIARSAPVRVPISGVTALATGPFHTCARTIEGEAWCWGRNDAGQLGTGGTAPVAAPVAVLDGGQPLRGVVELALTDASTCALLESGRVKCWGSGAHGRLGDGAAVDRLEPDWVTVAGSPLEGVAGIAAGLEHVCARMVDGTVRCWGSGTYGRLGVGDELGRLEPALVPGLAGVDEIAAAGWRSCARSGGTVHCWGTNAQGQVGDGMPGSARLLPSPVAGLTDAISLHLGQNHGFARRADGTTAGWGMPYGNLLHDGLPLDTGFRYAPTTLVEPGGGGPWTGLKDVLAGGYSFTCVVEANDAVWCWGYDNFGQLGDGGPVNSADVRPEPDLVAW